MDVNHQEVTLLWENPGELIVKYQPIVFVVVQIFMRGGYFRGEEKEEIVQSVNEKLLERIGKIREQYNGISRLRTYFSAVIRNLCLERIRKNRMEDLRRLVLEPDQNLSYSPDQLNRLIIRQELDRLEYIIKLFDYQRFKIILCMKAILRIPWQQEEMEGYGIEENTRELKEVVFILKRAGCVSDKQVYVSLSKIFNTYENKSNTLDAVRKWIWLKEEEIIRLLNGEPRRSNYDHETLRILLDRYFSEGRGSQLNGQNVYAGLTASGQSNH